MRLLILGGGPGGLYAGALLKQADPRRDVTLVERNPHDATYGWGVVFSDATLGSLRDSDPVSHRRIVDSFARWDALDVFSDHLAGHQLLSNRSLWLNFATVRNQCWRHRNVVLLGDAAHTAHFTIGSGTKLAMEDAVALTDALSRFDDAAEAGRFYERSREPVVEATQDAARQSSTWFESLDRYVRLEPVQFMFNFLTRSGRITYNDMRVRDSRLAERVDRWYAGRSNGRHAVVLAPPPMFTTARLRGLTLPNRAVLATVGSGDAVDGMPGAPHEEELLRLATGGAGLVLAEVTAVSANGRITPGDAGLWDDAQRAAWSSIVERVRRSSSAKVGLIIGHAGRRGATRARRHGIDLALAEGAWPLLSASPLPYGRGSQVPREATAQDFEGVVADFTAAASRAGEAGFDLLEVHAGHGYLLGSFLSPLSNQRTDGYGGDLAGRLRFPLAVIDAVRAVWPEDRPLAVALNATDWQPGGISDDEAVDVARAFAVHGCDVVDILAGQTTATATPHYGPFFLASHSERIRQDAGVTTLLRGRITTADDVDTALAAGRADLCLMDPWVLEEEDRR